MKVVLFCGGLGTRLARLLRRDPQADGADRPAAHPLASDEVLRPLRAHRVHPVPRIQEPGDQGVLPRLPRVGLQRLRALRRGTDIQLLSRDIDDWKITFAETGINSSIGERLKAVEPYLEDEEVFLANYSDGLTDLDLGEYVDTFLAQPDKVAELPRASNPPSRSMWPTSAENGEVSVDRSTQRVRPLDQWRLLRLPEGDLRASPPGRGPGVRAVPAPDRRAQAVGTPLSRLLDGDGHLQGPQALEERYGAGDAPWEVWKQTVSEPGCEL